MAAGKMEGGRTLTSGRGSSVPGLVSTPLCEADLKAELVISLMRASTPLWLRIQGLGIMAATGPSMRPRIASALEVVSCMGVFQSTMLMNERVIIRNALAIWAQVVG